jgi:hypothetical protein
MEWQPAMPVALNIEKRKIRSVSSPNSPILKDAEIFA